MIVYHTCPVCGSTRIAPAITVTDHSVTKEQFEVWECAACTLRFTQNVPDAGQIGRYYRSDDYISHTNSSKGIINRLYLIVRRFTLRSKRRFVQRWTRVRRGGLLDVGAGTGAFVAAMQAAGWQVTGLEPDAAAIANAKRLHNVELQPTDRLFGLRESSFDAVTLWHVLEHVHQLHEYFARLKSVCKPGGRLFIAVPNYTSFDAQRYGADWAAYDVPRHLYHFSPLAMHTLANIHGCRVEHCQPMWFDSFYVSMLSEKYRREGGLPAAVWTGLRSNAKAVSARREASSLIYVIRTDEGAASE